MNQTEVDAIALSVRSLSMDAVQAANSGHPGLPMGCAELGALLYGEILNHYPGDPDWPNRDRFILSAGHGSMLLYSLLHLAGYDLPFEELKNFRQIGSKTPGHPEYGHTVGVEMTTGPLGQGISSAVGFAIAERMSAGIYNTADQTIINHFTYVLAGDGDMMEGISSEACSLAGHLGLGRLIVFYDDNDISIDGSTDITFTEDVGKRFEAYGWQVLSADGYDAPAVIAATNEAQRVTDRPSFIVLKTVIGRGSPNRAGTSGIHGAALGEEEIGLTRKNLGLGPDDAFFIHPDAVTYFKQHREALRHRYDEWKAQFAQWRAKNPELAARWDTARAPGAKQAAGVTLPDFPTGEKVATRKASGKVLNAVADGMPSLVGGSADLAGSNITAMPQHGVFGAKTPAGRTINFGVREHAMGAICNGLALYGGFRPFCSTFHVFSDYLRPAIRLAALMGLPVIYVFTHDSIFVGEDGPTHQPIEHNAALRTIPGLDVLRPADAQETAEAWLMATERDDGPSALVLTRQNLLTFEKADPNWKKTARKGAYVAKECDGEPEVVLVATGSEVTLALEAAARSSKRIRVVSMISMDRFRDQNASFRDELLPPSVRIITAEVGVSFGWDGIASGRENVFALDRFGVSGPGAEVARQLGYTADALLALIEA